MTPKQKHWYDTGLWPEYTRILKSRGYKNADILQERDDLYVRALGARISSRKWTTDQFNAVIKEMEILTRAADLNAAMETIEERTRRTIYRTIMNLGYTPEYLEGMLFRFSKGKHHDLDELTPEQLRNFRKVAIISARKGYAKPRK